MRKLTLHWKLSNRPSNNVDNEDDVLEGLRPHCNLEILKIQGFMGVKFPSWLLLACNLKEIELSGCNKCEGFPILGHLPNLIHVKMKDMQNLRCLGSEFYGHDQISGATTSDGRKTLFPALRSLHIENAKNLIDWMEAGEVMLTAEKLRVFPYLEELKLKWCKQLRSAPSHFPSLKKLSIRGVESGMPIASILSNKLTTLTRLSIKYVEGLTSLPEGTLRNNKNLECLKIRNCPELSCIAPHGFDCCVSLQKLRIWLCSKLRYLSDGLLPLSLKELEIQNCSSLESIPIIPEQGGLPYLHRLLIFNCSQLSSLPDGLQYCTSLQLLYIGSCPEITSIPIPSEGLPSLRHLDLWRCPELSSLPSGLGCCTSLVDLLIAKCPKVTSIPIGSLSTTLRYLVVSNLESLPTLHGGFTSLRQLGIDGCQSTQIDLQFCAFLQIENLTIIDCPNLETVPSLDKLTSLRQLWIRDCSRLTCLPSGLAMASPHVFTRLKSLTLGPFWNELDSFPALQVLPQLGSLTILGWPKLKSLPEQIQHLTSLTYLWIQDFEGVDAIPEWFGNLASLHSLEIANCENLMYLPSVQAMQRLTKLDSLEISFCFLLRERCTAESGPEWPKISHIPNIKVNSVYINS